MQDDERKFEEFCLGQGYLTSAQLRRMRRKQRTLAEQGVRKSLPRLVAEALNWTPERLKEALSACGESEGGGLAEDPDVGISDPTIPSGEFPAPEDSAEISTKPDGLSGRSPNSPAPGFADPARKSDLPPQDNAPFAPAKGTPDAGPRKIDRYLVLREIGRGGMGVVYEVYDEALKRNVALKTLLPSMGFDGTELERFQREAQIAASLNHPGITRVYEVGRQGELYYFTMDFVEGVSLSEYVEKSRCPLKKTASLVRDVADALAYAHARDIVHRDIKPGNILVDASGKTHLMDFGLARNVKDEQKLTVSGVAFGTPAYMPPEQALGKLRQVDKRSDVYSLGAVLYHLLVGRPVFMGASLGETIKAITEQDPVPPRKLVKGLPKDLETICLKCLEKPSRRRYPNARALASELERFLKGSPIQARPIGPLQRIGRRIAANKLISALILAIFLGLCGFVHLFFLAPGRLTLALKNRPQNPVSFEIDERAAIPDAAGAFALASGYHYVTVRASGFETLGFPIRISAGKEVDVEKELVRRKGKLTIASRLAGFEAQLVSEETGESAALSAPLYGYEITAGTYQATFRKENHFPKSSRVAVAPEDSTALQVELEPMLVWRRTVSAKSDLVDAVVADLDGDGELELICGHDNGSFTSFEMSGHLRSWSLERQFQKDPHVGGRVEFRDINRDGTPDIVFPQFENFVILDGKTREEIFSAPSWWGRAHAFCDVDGDGREELILFCNYAGIQCRRIDGGGVLWRVEGRIHDMCSPALVSPNQVIHVCGGRVYALDVRSGTPVWEYRFADAGTAPNVAAFERDGRTAIVWCSKERGVSCLDVGSRKLLWESPLPEPAKAPVEPCDVDGDGREEILVSAKDLHCLDAEGREIWRFESGRQSIGTFLWCGDLEGDGAKEIVLARWHDGIYTLDAASGREIARFGLASGMGRITAVDLDGDNESEILFASSRHVYCIRHRPSAHLGVFGEGFPLSFSPPCAADFDGDGRKDFVLGTRSGEVLCLEGATGALLWRCEGLGDIVLECAVADLKGGRTDVAALTSEGTVFAIDSKGRKMWEQRLGKTAPACGKVLPANLDGAPGDELIVNVDGLLACLSGSDGSRIWARELERTRNRPCLEDVDRDGSLEVLIPSNMDPILHCLDARTGETEWTANMPQRSIAVEITRQDIDGDGFPELFAAHIPGFVSSYEGKTGRIRWQRRLRAATIQCPPLAGDFDGDGHWEILVAGEDENVHCLDAASGEIEWSRSFKGTWSSCFTLQFGACDLDGDGIDDVFAPSSEHAFYFFSGKNGRWLGHVDSFEPPASRFLAEDMDGDGRLDISFVDTNSRLLCLYDAPGYFRKSAKSLPGGLPERSFPGTLARLNWLMLHDSWDRLEDQLRSVEGRRGWEHVAEHFRGALAWSKGEAKKALEHLQKSGIFSGRFLQILCHIEGGDRARALSLSKELMSASILEFDACHRQHSPRLSASSRRALREISVAAAEKSGMVEAMDKAFENASFLQDAARERQFLELFLKYAPTGHPQYAKRRGIYERKVRELASLKNNVYHEHENLDLFDEALEIAPDSRELLCARARLWFETQISPERALEDLESALSIEPSAEIYLMRGSVFFAQKKLTEARWDFTQARKIAPEMSRARVSLAISCLAAGDGQSALRELQAVSKNPADPASEIARGLSLWAQGRPAEAQNFLIHAVRRQDIDPWLRRMLFELLR